MEDLAGELPKRCLIASHKHGGSALTRFINRRSQVSRWQCPDRSSSRGQRTTCVKLSRRAASTTRSVRAPASSLTPDVWAKPPEAAKTSPAFLAPV